MFSDNKNLIGNNPLYDNLVKSMEGFDYHYNRSCREGFVNPSNLDRMRELADSDLSDSDNFKKLHELMNMKVMHKYRGIGDMVYMDNGEAVDRHKCMMFNNVFTKKQWDKALSITDVFDFNDAFYFKRDFIYMHAGKFIECYGNLIVKELVNGCLSYKVMREMASDEWVDFMVSEKKRNPGLYDNKKLPYYSDAVCFIGDEMLNFCSKWNDSIATFVARMIDFIRSVSPTIENPYYKQDYVF